MSSQARLVLIAFFGLVALVCARLGVWQLQRLHDRRAANAVALQSRSATPVRLDSVTTGDSSLIERHVLATGRYDHAHDVVLRGRAYQGAPGVEIVTPLVFEGGRTAVLVNRGFVPAADAASVQLDSLREPGMVTVEGVGQALPSGKGAPLERAAGTTWARLDLEALEQRVPYTLAPIYIRQEPKAGLPRLPRRLEPAPIDDGPHLNYAIQWFAFALMALVFGVVVWRQANQQRKR